MGDTTYLITTPNSEILPINDVAVRLDELQYGDTQQSYVGQLISLSWATDISFIYERLLPVSILSTSNKVTTSG